MKRSRGKDVTALAKIGEDIERRWSARDYRDRYFPEIAADCLRTASFHRQFDEDEIIRWVNQATVLPGLRNTVTRTTGARR